MSTSAVKTSTDEHKQYPNRLRQEHIRPTNFVQYEAPDRNCPALIIDTYFNNAFSKMTVLYLDTMEQGEIHLGLGPGVEPNFTRSEERSYCTATPRENAIDYVRRRLNNLTAHSEASDRKEVHAKASHYQAEAESYGLI